jgi:hypothetical protein
VFATCLFCNSALGANEALEHFSVGRRLAFDAAKGRLWVVCPKCERWNLSPLEERWEAIEEAERAYRDTKKRVATEQIGLARLPDGTELVRIGAPLRPEFAAWRYGDQFGRRRRRQWLIGGGAAAVYGGLMIGGPLVGLAIGSGVGALANTFNVSNLLYQKFVPRVRVPLADGRLLAVSGLDLRKARFSLHRDCEVHVDFSYRNWHASGPLLTRLGMPQRPAMYGGGEHTLEGEDALRAMALMLPAMNTNGGSGGQVKKAVEAVEQSRNSVGALLRDALKAVPSFDFLTGRRAGTATAIPARFRLALEMAVHEDDERRALEGELHVLAERWKAAEEIAAIADSLTLPDDMERDLAALRERHATRDRHEPG